MRRIAFLTVATVLLLGGCTSSDSDGGLKPDPSDTASSASPDGGADDAPAAKGPSCDDVWQVGEDLPEDYSECAAGTQQGAQDVIDCQDGSKLVVFDNVLYGVTGQKIQEAQASPLQDTPEYGAVYSDCTGE